MSSRYFFGVDAGATKTHYVLYDRENGMLDLHTAGSANHENLSGGFSELESVLTREINILTNRHGITPAQIDAAGFGMAGVDTRRQHRTVSRILSGIGFWQFELANDSSLGIHADCPQGVGVCAINGSGFSVFAVDPSFNSVQIGGLGSLTGDKGGGSYYVGEAMSAVYAELYLGGVPTLMTKVVFDLLSIAEREDFMEKLTEELQGGNGKQMRKKLSELLHISARDGDAVARNILTQSGGAYAAAIYGAINALPKLKMQDTISLVLAGSGFTKCEYPLVEETIMKSLSESLGLNKVMIRRISSYPVMGALLWALRIAGVRLTGEEVSAIRGYLNTTMKV